MADSDTTCLYQMHVLHRAQRGFYVLQGCCLDGAFVVAPVASERHVLKCSCIVNAAASTGSPATPCACKPCP
jgi:hypothetical protein